VAAGRLVPSASPPDTPAHGSAVSVEGQVIAVYADEGTLWLQWNGTRWPLPGADLVLDYRHDLEAATTTFRANGHAVTYPAWWRGDPHFEAVLPELDEHHDYLAHVMQVKHDPSLQAALLGTP
jgi:hypothetical protein